MERRISDVQKLELEQNNLYNAYRRLGYIDLPKPIRHGWTRALVLREDISRRKDANLIKQVLNACKYEIWGRDKNHLNKNWRKYLIDRKSIVFPGIEMLELNAYKKLPNKVQQYFIPIKSDWCRWLGYRVRYKCVLPSYYFVSKDVRSYLTKQKVTDQSIESRLQEIEEILLSKKYYKFSYNGYSYKDLWAPKDKYHLFIKSSDKEMRLAMQKF